MSAIIRRSRVLPARPPSSHPQDGQRTRAQRLRPGLSISGYLLSEIGLGQAARNLAYACDSQRVPLSFRNMWLPDRQNDPEFVTKCNPSHDRAANLIILGLPAIEQTEREIGRGVRNIFYPFWELSGIPKNWLSLALQFEEIWAPSTFVASAFAGKIDRPIHLIRQPMRLPASAPPPRGRRDTFRVFTYLDFDSYGARKNPAATVKAFQAAFPPAQRDVELVIKVRGSDSRDLRPWLGEVAATDQRISVIDRTLDRAAMDELMAGCDAFISLHRSEGFGFGAAEAIAAGKPVVATDYGGTTDFITPSTGYPIEYVIENVKAGEYVHTDGQVWATARVDAAAAALRSVYANPAEAAARTRRGFDLLHAQNSLEVVGKQISVRLREIGALS